VPRPSFRGTPGVFLLVLVVRFREVSGLDVALHVVELRLDVVEFGLGLGRVEFGLGLVEADIQRLDAEFRGLLVGRLLRRLGRLVRFLVPVAHTNGFRQRAYERFPSGRQ